ncbi:hypothetical protein [Mesorhizobium sp. M8A.F.Ca.ET.207.01.1.1]|nr:hypothetical protein [Mesorhizobium sp. M8A.F.Ca.ET.207.01.1.1]
MFTPYAWYLLLSICSADPGVGCDHEVVAGFMACDLCTSAAVPITAIISG